ncbi:MAG: FtsX-like permease family protein [Chryseolinea sp.]
MNLPLFIARRYLFSTRKKNFINVISMISVVAVALISAAMIIVLSIFNGLGDLLHSINNSFDPEIKVVATRGKSFVVDGAMIESIKKINGVAIVTEVIEDNAYARYNGADQGVTVKGVSDNFIDQKRIPPSAMVEGELALKKGGRDRALIGYGIKSALSIAIDQDFYPLQLFYPRNARAGITDPSKLFAQKNIYPGGVFSIIQNFDESYVVVPLSFAKELFNYTDRRTSLEIKIRSDGNMDDIESRLQQTLGDEYKVLNGEEQHEDLYRVLKLEKLFASIAAALLLFIGSINIYFSLMMLALDKKKDITVLSSVGADSALLKKIFVTEGVLIAGIGTLSGLAIGALVVLLQQNFNLVSMGMDSAVVDGYPVKLALTDFVYVFLIMTVVTVLISSRPASLASSFASVRHL